MASDTLRIPKGMDDAKPREVASDETSLFDAVLDELVLQVEAYAESRASIEPDETREREYKRTTGVLRRVLLTLHNERIMGDAEL